MAYLPILPYTNSWVTLNGNPQDTGTYYFQNQNGFTVNTATQPVTRFYIPKNSIISTVTGTIFVLNQKASTENCTIAVRLNDTSNSNVTTTLQLIGSYNNFSNYDMKLAVSAGDFVEMIFISPTWVTNPLNCYANITLWGN